MVNDEVIIQIARQADAFLHEMCSKHNVSPLAASSIILARMVYMSHEYSYTDDFKQVMNVAGSAEKPQRVYQ